MIVRGCTGVWGRWRAELTSVGARPPRRIGRGRRRGLIASALLRGRRASGGRPIRTRRLLPQRRGRCRRADVRPVLRRRLSPTPPRGVLPRRGLRVPHAWAQSDDSAHPRVRLWEGEGASLFCGGFLRSLKWLHGTEGKTGRGSNEF